ncbi:PREDICTED: E3 ubiquitin-protein ligase RING1-like [Camelina sativa]|uniref:RING-type E3 ubiquitin transferase n=1 Tax=Camelina sativa TaxID=90675 RepID=A0ABM0VX85_CAMSA|nr:PREDICTED: E3 ubiquitin-protein ligase RING1-like [Camelina sativa]
MEEAVATRYWCHMCSQTVDPVMEAEIKCPFCHSGFVEEMADDDVHDDSSDARANNSLWAPILMELMTDPVRRRRNQSVESVEDTQNETGENNNNNTDLDSQLQEILRRRRRHSAAVLQLLQGIRAGLSLESESTGNGDHNNNTLDNNNPERVILINPFNQTITVQTSADRDSVPAGSLGDYFIGPGFEMLLQRLAENDPNRYGTPPAKKEAVEALSTVKIEETLQCSVCLDDFEIGTEAKLMPCKHKFHADCLLPWLELHSSCPVCRFQLPADEPKPDSATTTTSDNNGGSSASATSSSHGAGNSDGNRREEEEEEDGSEDNNDSGFSIPWPFSTLFSSSQDSNASTDSR